MNDLQSRIQQAGQTFREADALLIGAGAGMGVDSGLPDFRGDAGFWTAYTALYGKPFHSVANPHWFESDPTFAWGFYGHRYQLYRRTQPHAGYDMLRQWAESKPGGYFVFTSNVDSHFEKAGLSEERIVECHGSINYLQCVKECTNDIWQAVDLSLEIDEKTLRCTSALPRCLHCGGLARPNILMFGDYGWLDQRTAGQYQRYREWKHSSVGMKVVAIELGAGLAIPTVRLFCERESDVLIRINPREYELAADGVAIPLGALAGLRLIDIELRSIFNPTVKC